MTKCTSCGKDHAMVIEDMTTGETTPLDWCKECIFTKGYTYKEPEPLNLDAFADWGIELQRIQNQIIGDMSASANSNP